MRTVTSNRTFAPFGCRAVTRTIPPGAAAAVANPAIVYTSVPSIPSVAALYPAENCIGRTPIPTRFDR